MIDPADLLPATKAALLKASKSPKPKGWGKAANKWMLKWMLQAKRNRNEQQ